MNEQTALSLWKQKNNKDKEGAVKKSVILLFGASFLNI